MLKAAFGKLKSRALYDGEGVELEKNEVYVTCMPRFTSDRLLPSGDYLHSVPVQEFGPSVVDPSGWTTTAQLIASLGDDGIKKLTSAVTNYQYEFPASSDGKDPEVDLRSYEFSPVRDPGVDRAEISQAQLKAKAEYEQALVDEAKAKELEEFEKSLNKASEASKVASNAQSDAAAAQATAQ